jgi:hypothetical protein
MMTYPGHVQNGAVVLDEPISLPEGAKVTVALENDRGSLLDDSSLPSLYDQFQPFVGAAVGLPEDLAMNHDHYLHGQPKK